MFDYYPVTLPYPGLRPFEPHEGEIFFGRDGHTDRLLEILQRERFLAVIGPSGCGKSSLVRAGLLPALAGGRLGTGSHWRLALLRPGGQPLLALAQSLICRHALGPELVPYEAVAEDLADSDAQSRPAQLTAATIADATPDAALIAAELRQGIVGLERLLEQAQSCREARARGLVLPRLNLLVLVDQFEEIFTYGDSHADPGEAAAFVDLLLAMRESITAPGTHAIRPVVALTMRTDFLGHCVQFADLPEAINRTQYLTPRLKREELRTAIVGPARLFGGDVREDFSGEIIDKVGANSDQLPLLQHALARWWRVAEQEGAGEPIISAALTGRVGHVDRALNDHAEELFASFNLAEQGACEWIFRAITAGSERAEAVRRPQILADIAVWSGIECGLLCSVITKFAATEVSFLHHGRELEQADAAFIDLTHEALMRQWDRLKEWVRSEFQRGSGYRRWQARAAEHAAGEAGLLAGADLARALDWWNPGGDRDHWQPTLAWARRYSQAANDLQLAAEFEQTRQYLIESRDAERNEREAEQRRLAEEAAAERQRAEHERDLADRAQLSAQRARRMSKISLALASFAAVAAAFGWWQYLHAQEEERARTVSLFESEFSSAILLARGDDYASAWSALNESRKYEATIARGLRDARNLLAGHVAAMGGAADKVYRDGDKPLPSLVGGVVISPDGRYLAAAGELSTLVLFEAASGRLLQRLAEHDPQSSANAAVRAIAFDPQGGSVYSGGDDGRVIQWSVPSGEKLGEWNTGGAVRALAVRPDGRQLATGDAQGAITLWSLPDGGNPQMLLGHEKGMGDSTNPLVFSQDGKLLASASLDGSARIWDVVTGSCLRVISGHAEAVNGVDFSPDATLLATSGKDKQVMLWSVGSGRLLRTLSGHRNIVSSVRFGRDGKLLFSTSYDDSLRVWEVADGVSLRVFQGHEAPVLSVEVPAAREGGATEWVYTASVDGTVRRWPLSSPFATTFELPRLDPTVAEVANSVAIAPKGHWAVLGMSSGALRLYALPSWQVLGEVNRAHDGPVKRVAFSPDGERLASGSHDNKAKLWSVQHNRDGTIGLTLAHTIGDHDGLVHAVAFSPDGRRLATASYDGSIGVFDVYSGQLKRVGASRGKMASVTFDPSGQWLLAAAYDEKKILSWNVEQIDQPPRELARQQDEALWASIAPDGGHVAVVGRSTVVTLLGLDGSDSGAQHLVGHENAIFRAIYTPDSAQLATVSGDLTLRLWDISNQRLLFTQRLPAASSTDNRAVLWDFDFRCFPAPTTPGRECLALIPLTTGRVLGYRFPYDQFPSGLISP